MNIEPIEENKCPGGIVIQVQTMDGEIVTESTIVTGTPEEEIASLAFGDQMATLRGSHRHYKIMGYDGDTGECIGFIVVESGEMA